MIMVMVKETVVARVLLYMQNGLVIKREIKGTNSSKFRSKVHELNEQLVSDYLHGINTRISIHDNTNTDSPATFNDDMYVDMKQCIGFEVTIIPLISQVQPIDDYQHECFTIPFH